MTTQNPLIEMKGHSFPKRNGFSPEKGSTGNL
jgi:hypothetical protein